MNIKELSLMLVIAGRINIRLFTVVILKRVHKLYSLRTNSCKW